MTSRVAYNKCLGEVTIFHYNLTIFTKFQRLYNIVQNFWELQALAGGRYKKVYTELLIFSTFWAQMVTSLTHS